jgi:hypothetical protein
MTNNEATRIDMKKDLALHAFRDYDPAAYRRNIPNLSMMDRSVNSMPL